MSLAVAKLCFYATVFLCSFSTNSSMSLFVPGPLGFDAAEAAPILRAISLGMLAESGMGIGSISDIPFCCNTVALFSRSGNLDVGRSSGRRNAILDYIGLGHGGRVALIGIGLRADVAPGGRGTRGLQDSSIEGSQWLFWLVIPRLHVRVHRGRHVRPRSVGHGAPDAENSGMQPYPPYLISTMWFGRRLEHVLNPDGAMRPYVALVFGAWGRDRTLRG